MDENRFYRVVWRVNALLILGLGALGALTLIEEEFGDRLRHGRSPQGYARETETLPPPRLGLGELEIVGDGRWLVFPYTSMGIGGRRGQRAGETILDLLLLDTATNASRWLLDDPGAVVDSWWPVIDDGDPLLACRVSRGDGTREMLVADLTRGTTGTLARGLAEQLRIEVNGERLFCMYVGDEGTMTALFALDQGMACLDRRLLPQHPDHAGDGQD